MKVIDMSDGRFVIPPGTAVDLPFVGGQWEEITAVDFAAQHQRVEPGEATDLDQQRERTEFIEAWAVAEEGRPVQKPAAVELATPREGSDAAATERERLLQSWERQSG